MKIIEQKSIPEQSRVICDVCGKNAVSVLTINFGYGSSHDLERIQGDFCEEHGEELRKSLLKKYKRLRTEFWY